jgi:hypothetical protein
LRAARFLGFFNPHSSKENRQSDRQPSIAFLALGNGGLIANNTAVADGLLPTAGGCKPGISVGDKTNQGSSSHGVTLRNNLANVISVYNLDSGVTADHNVGMATAGAVFKWYVNGVAQFLALPDPTGATSLPRGALAPSLSTSIRRRLTT